MKYLELANLYKSLESTPKRLEKTRLLSEALACADEEDLARLIPLVQGTVFPPWSDKKVGVAERLVIKAMQTSFGEVSARIEQLWRELGDLGDAAEKIASKKRQATLFSQTLTIRKVFENIENIAELEGAGTVDRKIQLMAELLTSASPLESKYLVRTFLGQLRAGLGEGIVRDAIVWAFLAKVPYDPKKNDLGFTEECRKEYVSIIEKVQSAFDVATDFAEIGFIAKKEGIAGLRTVSLKPGRPVKAMLFQKANGMEDAFGIIGCPLFLEYKYDGFRMQIHKIRGEIRIFTRRLENVTSQFPDVVDRIQKSVRADEFIIDGEAIGLDAASGKYLPFQMISQRIKRKYDVEEMSRQYPVEIRVFDLLFLEGKSMISAPYLERRADVEKIVPKIPGSIAPAEMIKTSDLNEAKEFYDKALSEGMEGTMAKRPDAPYQPGSRVGFGVKVKPVMDSLDLVIVRAEWGEGKRAGWLTSFTLACQDDGQFLEIGNVGTGFKEKEEEGTSFEQMTSILSPFIENQDGRAVILKPVVVIEVKFEEIQRSPTYSSGYALRFPRLVRLREDKPVEEASTLDQVRDLFATQK